MGHLGELITRWDVAQPATIAVLLVGGGYLLGVRRVNRLHPQHPWRRRWSVFFACGLFALSYVTVGPIGAFDDVFFWSHMTQHIVLMMLAAPLLLLGEPVLLLLRASSRKTRRQLIVPVLRSRFVRLVTNPVFTWVFFAVVLIGTHFTHFYEFALEHPRVHELVEHPLYLTAGLLYFYPLLGISPGGSALPPFAKVVSLFAMMVPETVVGFSIYTSSHVLYPYYSTVTRPWGPATALDDQRLAGAFMWSSGMVFNAIWIAVAAWEWWADEERRAKRIDASLAAARPARET